MSIQIIQQRLEEYKCNSIQEEENALREITQEVALNALFNANFFDRAAMHGGTCLRIFYGLNRFSEDLDFALIKPDSKFSISPYSKALEKELAAFGYSLNVTEKKNVDQNVKKIFFKDGSLGKLLDIEYPRLNGRQKMIRIKLEVDINPPLGALLENKYHGFPLNFAVTVHDKPTLFAGKSHALLCRQYTKGRDWYDFLWYVNHGTQINFDFLKNAINQNGPWIDQNIAIDKGWYLSELKKTIERTDWTTAKDDLKRFIKPNELKALELWNTDYFLAHIDKLAESL